MAAELILIRSLQPYHDRKNKHKAHLIANHWSGSSYMWERVVVLASESTCIPVHHAVAQQEDLARVKNQKV